MHATREHIIELFQLALGIEEPLATIQGQIALYNRLEETTLPT